MGMAHFSLIHDRIIKKERYL